MSEGKILIVEDEPSLREVIALYLRRANFEVVSVADGQAALEALQAGPVSLVVLDLMIPKVDGYQVTEWLRRRGDTPIIMVTARRAESDRIAGLEMGADDYVIKPFSPQELTSRVRAVLRRSRATPAPAASAEAAVLEYPGLRIEPATRVVSVDGSERSLTAKEFDLLLHLARHPRQVFSRDQLLDRVWGVSEYVDPSTVTVHVRRLREKIEADPSQPRFIQTVWGVGYKFEAPA